MSNNGDSGTITLYVACSVDGFVATEDGGIEWLDEFGDDAEDEDASSYEAFYADIDCLVMGSTTYEQVLEFGEWPYDPTPTYVMTSRDLPLAADTVELVDESVEALATRLREEFEHVWLVGGAALAQSFLRDGLLDELRLNVVPVVLGSGITLFEDGGPHRDLSFVAATSYDSGIVELQYGVEN